MRTNGLIRIWLAVVVILTISFFFLLSTLGSPCNLPTEGEDQSCVVSYLQYGKPDDPQWQLSRVSPKSIGDYIAIAEYVNTSPDELLGELANRYMKMGYERNDFSQVIGGLSLFIRSRDESMVAKFRKEITDYQEDNVYVFIDPDCSNCWKITSEIKKYRKMLDELKNQRFVYYICSNIDNHHDASINAIKLEALCRSISKNDRFRIGTEEVIEEVLEFAISSNVGISNAIDIVDEIYECDDDEICMKEANETILKNSKLISSFGLYTPAVIYRGRVLRKYKMDDFAFNPLRDGLHLIWSIHLSTIYDCIYATRGLANEGGIHEK